MQHPGLILHGLVSFLQKLSRDLRKCHGEESRTIGALANISDESNPLWETFKVDIVPTLVGFRDGLVIIRKDGVASIGLGMPELEDALRKMEKR